jgi:hypothetical protein
MTAGGYHLEPAGGDVQDYGTVAVGSGVGRMAHFVWKGCW